LGMKIILSPSKTQSEHGTFTPSNKMPLNQELSLNLFQEMKSIREESLGKLMKIKGTLLAETYNLYQGFQPSNPRLAAINCYQGLVFHEIKTRVYNEDQLNYMNHHLAILSAMYGVLEPDTQIWPYRLDMTVKLSKINLYEYWKKTVEGYFSKEHLMINLASEEFSKLLKPFSHKMIHIHFGEKNKDGKLKVVSVRAKKARGMMAHQMISHKIGEIQRIKNFEVMGYVFDQEISNDTNYFFVQQ
jgi:uncharacterized protein